LRNSSFAADLILSLRHFSNAVATEKSRKMFVNNILAKYRAFDLDGIDIDWEYPGKDGGSGNHVSSDDAANFLLFLKLLRAMLPSTARISAAVETTTFVGNEGEPMQDMREFASVLDWILLMDYDVWGCKLSILSILAGALGDNLLKHPRGLAQTLLYMTAAATPRSLMRAQLQGIIPGLQRTSLPARLCLDYRLTATSLPPLQSVFGQGRSPLGLDGNPVPSRWSVARGIARFSSGISSDKEPSYDHQA
jgi:hypothetical protein